MGASSFLGTLSREHRSSLQPLDMSVLDAASVLKTCFDICKWFYDQKELNDEAKSHVADLADYVRRLLPSLQSLKREGLESATLQLSYLWACLRECQRIYVKYKDGSRPARKVAQRCCG